MRSLVLRSFVKAATLTECQHHPTRRSCARTSVEFRADLEHTANNFRHGHI